jgi:hypothetical protein
MKITPQTIVLCLSLILNALGGSGIVPPVSGPAAAVPCAPSATAVDAGLDAQ